MNLKEELVQDALEKSVETVSGFRLGLKRVKCLKDFSSEKLNFENGKSYPLWIQRAKVMEHDWLSTVIVVPEHDKPWVFEIPEWVFGQFEKCPDVKEVQLKGENYTLVYDPECQRRLIPSWRLDKRQVERFAEKCLEAKFGESCKAVGRVYRTKKNSLIAAMEVTYTPLEGQASTYIFDILADDETDESQNVSEKAVGKFFRNTLDLVGQVSICSGHKAFVWDKWKVSCKGNKIVLDYCKNGLF